MVKNKNKNKKSSQAKDKKSSQTKAQRLERISTYLDKNFVGLNLHEAIRFLDGKKNELLLEGLIQKVNEVNKSFVENLTILSKEIEELKKQKIKKD